MDLGQTATPSSSRFERVDLNVHGDNRCLTRFQVRGLALACIVKLLSYHLILPAGDCRVVQFDPWAKNLVFSLAESLARSRRKSQFPSNSTGVIHSELCVQ